MKRSGRLRKRRLRTRADGPSDRELDAACRAVVFERDGHKCLRCGSTSHLQWAHVVSRRYKCLRWSPRASMCLCAKCHLDWHHRPVEASLWWVSLVGPGVEAQLRYTLKSPGKIDRKLTLLWLEQELKKLRA